MKVLFSVVAILLLATQPAGAQGYPDKPIRMIVPYSAGGPTDITARALAEDMGQQFGQTIIVDNRPGATGLIATRFVARAAPDGYTLLYTSLNHTVNPLLMKDADYDPIKDFAPISQVSSSPAMLIIGADQPYRTLKDLVDAAKGEKSRISFGSAGYGGSSHLAGEMLRKQTGADMLHVPFKGNGPAVVDLMSGQITFMFYPYSGLPELLSGKRVRGLAVTTAERDPRFPDIPTMKELGYPNFENSHPWTGLLAPAGTPQAIIDKLANAVKRSVATGKVRERGEQTGSVMIGSTPAEFAKFIAQDSDRWRQIIAEAGLKPQ
jgi:tripartite-type tricarboxylate transporter receptor subunit TctC